MIIVRLNNGELHKDIPSWDAFDTKNGIKDIILTDGNDLKTTISGYDAYTVEKERVAGWSGACYVTKEIVYGYRNLDDCKAQLLDALNKKIKSIIDQKFDNEKTKIALASCKKNYEILLDRLEQSEVDVYTLQVTVANKKRNKINFYPAAIKEVDRQTHSIEKFLGRGYEKRI